MRSRSKIKFLSVGFSLLLGFVAYGLFRLFWGPVLAFGLSVIPPNAQYAWVGKLIVTGLVAYFGGVAFPLLFAVLAGYFLVLGLTE